MVLPQELVDIIIDLAQDDRHAMAACALVCKAWVPRSRHHLFKRIELGSADIPSFLQLLKTRPSNVTFLQHATCFEYRHEPIATEMLDIRCTTWKVQGQPSWRQVFPHLKKGKFEATGVSSLHLSSLGWSRRDTRAVASVFPNITRLELRHISFKHLSHLFQLLSVFPAMEHLALIGVGSVDPLIPRPHRQQPRLIQALPMIKLRPTIPTRIIHVDQYPIPPFLRSLRLASMSPYVNQQNFDLLHLFLPEVSLRERPAHIQRLDITISSLDDLQATGEFLKSHGRQLSELQLKLDWPSRDMVTAFHRYIDMSVLSNLRSLHLITGISPDNGRWIHECLSDTTSSYGLEVVKLTLLRYFWMFKWDDIPRIYALPQYARLQHLRFTMHRNHAIPGGDRSDYSNNRLIHEAEAEITRKLSDYAEGRGISLHFDKFDARPQGILANEEDYYPA